MSIATLPQKVVFIGTGTFGAPTLQALLCDERFEVTDIVTGIDKPAGRGHVMTESPLLCCILDKYSLNNISIHKTAKITSELTNTFSPDSILLVVAFGQIIPEKILSLFPSYWINVHPSLLPKYRGASPIQETLLRGDNKTAVSWIVMSSRMDAGPIIEQKNYTITTGENYTQLSQNLAYLSAQETPEVILQYVRNSKMSDQEEAAASYCRKIQKQDGMIDFEKESAQVVLGKVRAFNEWPTVSFRLKDMMVKIIEARLSEVSLAPGVFHEAQDGLVVGTEHGSLLLEKVQPQSKSIMAGSDFLRGYRKVIFS